MRFTSTFSIRYGLRSCLPAGNPYRTRRNRCCANSGKYSVYRRRNWHAGRYPEDECKTWSHCWIDFQLRTILFRLNFRPISPFRRWCTHHGKTDLYVYRYGISSKSLPVSQFEMHAAEDFGIYKFDILSQRGLGHIKGNGETCKSAIVALMWMSINSENLRRTKKLKSPPPQQNHGLLFMLNRPPCACCWRNSNDDYLTLIAASSIIRPGVASSAWCGYIKRFPHDESGSTVWINSPGDGWTDGRYLWRDGVPGGMSSKLHITSVN